ncbi:hypothetical protein AZF37_04505 [endosymbiont 'TC1' of Trimyema compressum]|uniref:Stp1/IreP family PP2C-type Ser/Thr phosphatase n=1 Tax=endosymbiont 'TC1' of Trimyema compressum TaxID=243899 RepID=UPI0007F0C5AA|nr:Stp1/IreP family PP2C-type Ser/Thr phosphatase [endosymbiont 'TC1' of Trimyema compressum]AMP20528.1 hypothetical protein AZF37_04505 [endosymbiont 'TC1' of Trimyema compressum]
MRSWAVSETGSVRKNNEDSIYANTEKGFFVIADGMGGHEAGEVASSMAVEKIRIELEDKETIDSKTLENAFKETNKLIFDTSSFEKQQLIMGTTLTVLKIEKDKGYLGHIGDSRIYLIRNQEIIKLTEDHTYVEKLYQEGIITFEEYENHPKKNILLKALGSDKPIEPQILEFQILDGDIIFLCSDGVYNLLQDEELISILLQKEGDERVQTISNLIIERDAVDNFSFIIIDKIFGEDR